MRICLCGTLNLSGWHDQERQLTDLDASLGLLSLAAVLERAGYLVAFIDWNHEVSSTRLELDENFYEAAALRIAGESPDVVGFSTMCNSYHITLRMAEAWKRLHPRVPVILGGPQASVADTQTLAAFPFVDFILRGEAERTFPQFLAEWTAGARDFATPGLTYRQATGIARNADAELLPDLDDLPFPAYEMLPFSPAASAVIDAGRGCPYECTFCSTSMFWKRRFRLKSIDRILLEMKMLRDRYGAENFSFQHDLFTLNQHRVEEFCERLIAENWKPRWVCSARVDCITPQLLGRMAETGCSDIFFGVETGSCRMQKEIRKRLKLEQVWIAVDAALSSGINPTVSFIVGYPAETEDDLRQTMEMIEGLLTRPRVRVQAHLLGPQLGTWDYAQYGARLRFDGYYSDIADTVHLLLEPSWFQAFPELFTSFHYYEPVSLSRELVKGLDLFVHGPCATLRKAVLELARARGGLWQVYREWRAWSMPRGLGRGPFAGQRLDEFLMDFYSFIEEVATQSEGIHTDAARDAILAFYLRHYNETPVRVVPATEDAAALAASGTD
jgi:radical SAM superfamily enzyme YgiQ (UPF0313 family)